MVGRGLRRKREGRGSEIKVQVPWSWEAGQPGWAGGARAGRHCTAGTMPSMGWTGREAAIAENKKPSRSGEEEGRADGLHLNKPQPPTGQVDTLTSSPSADRSRPASACLLARQDQEAPLNPRRKHSQLVSADVRVSGRGNRRGPRGARRRHPPSIAAGLTGKHKDQFGNGFCQFGTRERKGMRGKTGWRCRWDREEG